MISDRTDRDIIFFVKILSVFLALQNYSFVGDINDRADLLGGNGSEISASVLHGVRRSYSFHSISLSIKS